MDSNRPPTFISSAQDCASSRRPEPEQKFRLRGFTLIEMIMVIVIIGILSVAGAYLLSSVLQSSSYIPSQLNTEMIATDALDMMIEGDPQARGLRFSKDLTNIQDNELTFTNQDNAVVRYHLDTNNNKLYRSINGGTDQLIPYYVPEGVAMLGSGNRLFTYLDANENQTNILSAVKNIRINVLARAGTGQFEQWEGETQLASAVTVKRYPDVVGVGAGPGAGPPGPGAECWPPGHCKDNGPGNGNGNGPGNGNGNGNGNAVCPDGTCNGSETCSTCPQDCGTCPAGCPDGTCNGTETCSTCPQDCGTCAPSCGNGNCNGSETCSTCPQDCGPCAPACPDGTCNGTETCSTCPQDCGTCTSACGDHQCTGNETCSSCPSDCGACPSCPDHICNGNENCNTCPADCGSCPPTGEGSHGGKGACPNGLCDGKETCRTCPQDCGPC